MTNKQKIAILKKMRALLKSKKESCFCFAYERATPSERYRTLKSITKSVIALGLEKPKITFDDVMWYSSDQTIRIRKIDELIKRLSK